MSNAKSSIPPLLESLLQDLHNDFFSDTKTFLRKLETLLLDIPLHSSPEILSKITSLLLLDKKTSLFKYLTSKLGDKERISSSFRKGLLEVIKKYLKAYEKGFSSQVLGIVKTSCLHLFQTDLTAAVKEGALSPIILLVKRFPKVPMKALLQPEKLMEIILKNLRDMKHSAGVKAKLWHLAGLLCSQYSREVDHYRLEVSEVCFNELMSQVESKSKPEIIVIEGLLKGLLQLLYENYLTAGQIQRLWNVLQVLMTPIADVHNYKVINMSLKLVGAHCGLFTAQILKDAIKILDLTLSLFKLTNRTVRERAGECLESLIRILVSLLSPTEEPHKLLFKEILEKVLRLLDQTDVVLLSSGIRVLGHFSRSVRLFRSEGKVRELFTQMLEFSHEKLIKPLENMTPSPDQEEGPLTSQADSFKTILFLQKQVFCFILAFSSVIENLSSLLEKEAIGLFQLSLLAIKAHKQYLQSYKPQLYESLVTLFLSLYVHHHIVFIPWCRKLFSQGLFESLKIPENVILAGEDYHSSLKSACDIWQGLFANGSCWTEASRGLFLSCFFQEVDAQLRALDLSYVISKEEGVEAVYSPNNQDHQQYIYRIVLFLDEILRMREIRETGVLNVWVPNLVRTAIEKLRKFSRITAFYKLLRVSNEVIEELHLFERSESINNPEIIEFKTLLLAFYQEASHNIKLFQEDLLIDALKALIAIPSNLILSSPLLQKLSLIHLKQAFLIKSPLILSLLSLALESLERILSRSLSLKDPFFQDLAPEILPYMASGLYFEAQNLKSLDKKLLFTLTYREIQIEVSAFQDRILDFLGKISGLAHYLIGDPKKNDLEEDSLLLWDTESTISFPLPLTSKKVELNMQQFLPRVLYLLKEGPSLQIQTIAGEFLHGLLIYMIGKSSQGQGKTRGPQQKKKSFAVIYSKILPSLFQIAANPGHPCGKLLGALGLQAVRWLANTRESESPDLVVLINVLMDGLASKEDSSLRDFSYKALLELLIWTVKQRTHAELEQDPGIFRTLLKRIASFSTNPDCLKRHAALLALKAFVLSYKEDSFLGKKFGMESFRICLRLAGSTDETNALSDSKEQLLFLIERHETLLLKSNAFKGQELLLQEIKEGCFRQEPLLREVSLKLFESLLKTGLLKLEETLWNSLCKSIISPLSFLKEGFSNKTLELFTGQMDFWLLIAQKISFRVLELKEFIRSCHNIKSFIEAFAGGNSSMNEKNVLQGVFTSGKEFRGSLKVYQAFKELLIFFNGVEIGLLKALFKAAFQKDALFDCFLQALYKSNPGLFPQSELLFEDIIKEIGKLTKKMEETGLIQEENKSDFVKKALEALSFKNSSELASAVFKGQIGAKKSRFWLDSFGIFLTETNKRAFLRDILSFLSSELDGNSVFTETESSGLQALLEFLSISDYEEIRAFFLEAFLRQNTVFQRFEGIFLGFFAREMQGFEKALELIRETPELLRFLVPILILGALDKRLGFCEKTLEMMNSGEFMKEIGGLFLDKERGLLILKTMVFIFSSQEKNLGLLLKKAGSFIPELISEGLKYPQNPITVIEQAFVLLAYVIKSNDPDFKRDFFEDKLSALLAGILSLSRELNPLMEEEIQEIGGLTKENHPYEQNKGHSSIILSLGTSFLSFLKLTRQFPFIRKYLYHLLRVPELKKPCRETLHSLLTLDFPTLTQLEQNTFLEDLLCDLLDSTGNKEAICPFICETIRFLFNSPEFPQGLILEFTEKAARPLLKVLGEVNGNLTKKALFLGIFETVYENLGLERIREDLHKRLYGIESSRNELTKNLIEICNQAKKTRYFFVWFF